MIAGTTFEIAKTITSYLWTKRIVVVIRCATWKLSCSVDSCFSHGENQNLSTIKLSYPTFAEFVLLHTLKKNCIRTSFLPVEIKHRSPIFCSFILALSKQSYQKLQICFFLLCCLAKPIFLFPGRRQNLSWWCASKKSNGKKKHRTK